MHPWWNCFPLTLVKGPIAPTHLKKLPSSVVETPLCLLNHLWMWPARMGIGHPRVGSLLVLRRVQGQTRVVSLKVQHWYTWTRKIVWQCTPAHKNTISLSILYYRECWRSQKLEEILTWVVFWEELLYSLGKCLSVGDKATILWDPSIYYYLAICCQ